MKTLPGYSTEFTMHKPLSQERRPAEKCGLAALSENDPRGIGCQPYPQAGRLADSMNEHLANLRAETGFAQATVYCYVIATIKTRNGQFYQRGSGPNFQGGLITLCTCKHFMRTFLDTEQWPGKWIAGFSGVAAGNGHNALVYLMKVGHAFASHQSLWFSDQISDEARRAKSASLSRFGDVYRPKSPVNDPFDVRSYAQPCEDHVHAKDDAWHHDINYEGCKGRKAALLVGDPAHSFLWNKPMLFYIGGRIHRGQKKMDLSNLLDQLEETIR